MFSKILCLFALVSSAAAFAPMVRNAQPRVVTQAGES
jgi:hypothetical protein